MRLYSYYNSQCEVDNDTGEKRGGPWRRLPSYDRFHMSENGESTWTDVSKVEPGSATLIGGVYLNKYIQANAREFTRSIKTAGAAFEYVVFINKEEQRSVCIFQAGYLLEGAPGIVHGGAISTMIDTATGIHATHVYGPVMTVNLNMNYYSPIALGSTVLIESSLDKSTGRKHFISCKVTSSDGSTLHTEATALFLSVNVNVHHPSRM
ncbi:acyl-coenzyme A thioesterase THEM4 isoform X3 [Festucalex cinctus]